MSRQFLRIKAKKVLNELKKTRPEFKNFTVSMFWPLFLATEKNQAKIRESLISIDSLDESDLVFDTLDDSDQDLTEVIEGIVEDDE